MSKLYIAVNKYSPDICKIGFTERDDVTDRMREFESTGTAGKFEPVIIVDTPRAEVLERALHQHFRLDNIREGRSREWFKVTPVDVGVVIEKLGYKISWSLANEKIKIAERLKRDKIKAAKQKVIDAETRRKDKAERKRREAVKMQARRRAAEPAAYVAARELIKENKSGARSVGNLGAVLFFALFMLSAGITKEYGTNFTEIFTAEGCITLLILAPIAGYIFAYKLVSRNHVKFNLAS